MANVFLAAALLSGILVVSGCAGMVPGLGALGSAGGGYPSYGGPQAYPYDLGQGGGYAQPVQPYYQPQPNVYYGNPEVYAYQPEQPVPQATQGYSAGPSGRWLDRRQQHQQDRMHRGQAPGHLTPIEARRWRNEPAHIRGAQGQMRTNGHLSPQGQGHLNTMQNRGGQGVQPGPGVQARPTGPGQPTAQLHPGGQPQAPMQARAAGQPRANGGRPARHDGSTR